MGRANDTYDQRVLATPKIKFCGLTRAEDVLAAVVLGVDAIGFNLARGPRKISVEQAAELARLLPPFVVVVALLVDADEATIMAAVSALRAGAVQLHGVEPPELAARLRLRLPVIKAFNVTGPAVLAAAAAYPCDAVLLDAPAVAGSGGTGASWDYRQAAVGMGVGKPVLLAGGLKPDTVAAAIAAARPFAVDVSSGIESAPGVKDAEKMQRFVAAVRLQC